MLAKCEPPRGADRAALNQRFEFGSTETKAAGSLTHRATKGFDPKVEHASGAGGSFVSPPRGLQTARRPRFLPPVLTGSPTSNSNIQAATFLSPTHTLARSATLSPRACVARRRLSDGMGCSAAVVGRRQECRRSLRAPCALRFLAGKFATTRNRSLHRCSPATFHA